MRLASLLFALAIVGSQVVAGDHVGQLKSICANDKKAELSRATELHQLVAASTSAVGCSERILAALTELDHLINSDNANVCSANKIAQIRAYYAKYVDKKSLSEQREAKLPRAILKLFLSYGFRVSRVCKTNMIDSLVSDGHRLLTDADFDLIKPMTSDSSPIGSMIKKTRDVDDLVLPREIVSLLLKKKNKASVDNDERMSVVLHSTKSRLMKQIQGVCGRRFQPIYQQLILPLIALSRLGLNYRDDEVKERMKEMRHNTEVQQWYRIVFLCESLKNVEILQDPDESAEGLKLVRVLNAQEADELRSRQPTGGHEDGQAEKIDYHQADAKLTVGDLIVDKQDKSVRKLAHKFSARHSELGRIRFRATRQMVRFMKDALKSGKVAIVKGLVKSSMAKGGSINDDLVKAIDSYAGQMTPDSADDVSVAAPGAHSRVKRFVVVVGIGGLIILTLAIIGLICVFNRIG